MRVINNYFKLLLITFQKGYGLRKSIINTLNADKEIFILAAINAYHLMSYIIL